MSRVHCKPTRTIWHANHCAPRRLPRLSGPSSPLSRVLDAMHVRPRIVKACTMYGVSRKSAVIQLYYTNTKANELLLRVVRSKSSARSRKKTILFVFHQFNHFIIPEPMSCRHYWPFLNDTCRPCHCTFSTRH
jgi:hypothetical protein